MKNKNNKNNTIANKQENIEQTISSNKKDNNNCNHHQTTNFDEELFIEKDHKGIKIFISIIIILLLIGGASLLYYFKIYNNPMLVIGNILKENKNNLKIPDIQEVNPYKISGTLDLDLGFTDQKKQKLADIINDIKLQYNLSVDNNNYIIMELYSKYQNDKLINLKAILNNEDMTAYIYLEDIFDKYLKTNLSLENEITNIENINYNAIINSIYKAFSNIIQEEDFERAFDKININGKETKVYRNSIIINQNNYKRITTSIIEELLHDEDFIKEVNKLFKDKDIKETLNELISKINESIFKEVIKINFYTKPNLRQQLLKLEIARINENDKYHLTFTKINERELIVDVTNNNEQIATININRNSDNNMIINYNFNNDGNEIKFSLNMFYEKLDKIEKVNTNSNVEINNLKSEDTTQIITNLMENKILINLINDINNIFSLNM